MKTHHITFSGLFILIAMILSQCVGIAVVTDKPDSSPTKMDSGTWKTLDSLDNLGLYRSARDLSNQLLDEALEANQPAASVKALRYWLKFDEMLNEAFERDLWPELRSAVEESEAPTRYLMAALSAHRLWSHYNAHFWEVNQQKTSSDADDIRLWSKSEYEAKIDSLYALSISDPIQLHEMDWRDLKEVLAGDSAGCSDGWTTFDLIAREAIAYYSDPKVNIQSLEQVVDEPTHLLAGNSKFLKTTLNPNSDSYWQEILRLFQQRTRFQVDDKNEVAVAQITVERLQHFRNHSNIPKSDSLYLQTLENTRIGMSSQVAKAFISIAMAELYEQQTNSNAPNLVRAKALCEEILSCEQCPKVVLKSAEAMLSRIGRMELSFVTEKVILPGEPWRALINFRNISECYYTVVPFNYNDYLEAMELRDQKDRVARITGMAQLRGLPFRVPLEDWGDHVTHHLEINHEALSAGFYVLIAAPSRTITYERTNIVINPIWVSEVAWTHRMDNQRRNEFRFVHRGTGAPLSKLSVEVYDQQYSQYQQGLKRNHTESLTTDENGLVKTSQGDRDRRLVFQVIYPNDTIWIDQSFYQSNARKGEPARTQTHFYTDRKVYRPGQTVYFKALCITTDGEEKKIRPGLSETITLFDFNSQEKGKLKRTSNEFGSYSGSFVLPETGITGTFRIQSSHGSHFFNVEEYKRPTFTVKMTPSDSAYSLDSEVVMRGTAQSLAGYPIAQAEVRYNVKRSLEQPFWGRYGWPQPASNQEISAGTAKTDNEGNFKIRFSAIAGGAISQHDLYRFEIAVEVVDMSGEMQGASQVIRIGKQSLFLNTKMEEVVLGGKLREIEILAHNADGESVEASGKVEIYRLKIPETPLRERIYQQPDQIQLDSLTFIELFPEDVFRQSPEISKAPIGEVVFETNFHTGGSKTVQVGSSDTWGNGWYMLRITAKDNEGKPVVHEHRFSFTNPDQSQSLPQFLWSHVQQEEAQPGEEVVLWVSSAKPIQLWVEVEVQGEITHQELVSLNNSYRQLKIPVTENCRGNFGIHLSTVYNNRLYSETHTIQVPYNNKKLKLEMETMRDHLEPGSEEKWTVKVTDLEGKPFHAELLAGMYDASLDALGFENRWSLNPFSGRRIALGWLNSNAFVANGGWQLQVNWNNVQYYYAPEPCKIDFGGGMRFGRGGEMMMDAVMMKGEDGESSEFSEEMEVVDKAPAKAEKTSNEIPVREDFNETAFFHPELRTDGSGRVQFEFTLPESLTTWKWMLLAHGQSLENGTTEGAVEARKPLMVIANPPRFLRSGDRFEWSAQVVNKTDRPQSVKVRLGLADAITESSMTNQVLIDAETREIQLQPEESKSVKWKVQIPENVGLVNIQTTAQAEGFSDGEQRTLPILTRKMLVTETLPITFTNSGTKTFEMDRLLASEGDTEIDHHRLTFEYSANPAWYAVLALPYMMEYPHDCSEQVFSRFYANSLAAQIVQSKPAIAEMFKRYAAADAGVLLSNLEKNQELKELVLEETPWLIDAQNETASMQRIALLFELDRMQKEQEKSLKKLAESQLPGGAWPWFKGMRSDRYITQYILEGLGKLRQLGVDISAHSGSDEMIRKAIQFLDTEMVDIHSNKDTLLKKQFGQLDVQYLYLRSLFPEYPINNAAALVMEKLWVKARDRWTQLGIYSQAMLGLAAHRHQQSDLSESILASLNERGLVHPDYGRYWKMQSGPYWHQQKIEAHTMLMALYRETGASDSWMNEMKIWLLTQKRVQHWETTTATANACYALLIDGNDWLETEEWPEINIGELQLQYDEGPVGDNTVFVHPEPGTGHFKRSWDAKDIVPEMGKVEITNKNSGPAWGAMYWQFFQDMDQVEGHNTTIQVDRQYFAVKIEEGKAHYVPLSETTVHPGDRLVVRIVLETDLDLEYVHLSDKRASGMEPMDVRSGHEYSHGLGYYRAVGDVAQHFFIDRLPKGRHVLEYELRANLGGDFANGPCVLQSMYAPEFSARSSGQRMVIDSMNE